MDIKQVNPLHAVAYGVYILGVSLPISLARIAIAAFHIIKHNNQRSFYQNAKQPEKPLPPLQWLNKEATLSKSSSEGNQFIAVFNECEQATLDKGLKEQPKKRLIDLEEKLLEVWEEELWRSFQELIFIIGPLYNTIKDAIANSNDQLTIMRPGLLGIDRIVESMRLESLLNSSSKLLEKTTQTEQNPFEQRFFGHETGTGVN